MQNEPVAETEPVQYARVGPVALLHLNRPRRLNAVVPPLVDALLDSLDRARDEGAASIVLAGRGRAFCAGYDLREPEPVETVDESRARLQRLQDVTRRIVQFPGPVIAAVHGYALGAGAEFALGCDLVIAGEDAVFAFPEVEVGLSVTGGISHLLPRMVGLSRAKQLVLLGERVSARQAHDLGLVARVVPQGAHEEASIALAEQLAARPSMALAMAKRALDTGIAVSLEESLDREVDDALSTLASGDARSAADRFREQH